MSYVVASFSGGKDSTAMVLHMIELGEQLDEVITCDTGMEFPQMYDHIEKVRRIIEGAGIKYTVLKADRTFEDMLLNSPPTDKRPYAGYGWPVVRIRWCTKFLKTELIRKYVAEHPDATQCVGLALDEQDRRERERTTKNSATPSPNGAGPKRTPSRIAGPGATIGADYTTGLSAYPAGAVPFSRSVSSVNYGNTTPSYGPGWRCTTGSSRTASIMTVRLRSIGSLIIPGASRGKPEPRGSRQLLCNLRRLPMTDGTLLVDVDSTIPNLALMHISTWKKEEGQQVGFNIPDPAEVYASCVFDWNRHKTDGLRFLYPNAKIDIGGGGIDLHKNLPQGVDTLMPDYSLYPDCDYDLGFTTRGCPNKCPFCVVPTKEGQLRRNQHPREFHDQSHKKAVYMDNNILADRDWFFEVTDWLLANKMKVDFNQGLDLRRIDKEIAERIAELRPLNKWRFAYDSLAVTEGVVRGLNQLMDAGINLRSLGLVYVYTDGDHDFDSALERCRRLRSMNILPYPMFNRHAVKTQRMMNLKRWARPWTFFKMDYQDYNREYRRKC